MKDHRPLLFNFRAEKYRQFFGNPSLVLHCYLISSRDELVQDQILQQKESHLINCALAPFDDAFPSTSSAPCPDS